jgi:hypothetical protein
MRNSPTLMPATLDLSPAGESPDERQLGRHGGGRVNAGSRIVQLR